MQVESFELHEQAAPATTLDVQLDKPLIKELLRDDPEFFINFFLGDQITHNVPDFHKDIFNEMTHANVRRLVLAIPRAHSKTTLAKLAAVWYLIFSDFRFVLYVSGSHDLVVPYVNDIASFFVTPNFIAVFGEVQWLKKQDGNGVYKFRIPSLQNKTCIVCGLGAGQRIRGINVDNERPQLVIADDIEDDEDVKNPRNHDGMLEWWMGPFNKCLNPFKNKIVVAGNLVSKKSVLWKFLQSPRWRSYLLGCIKADGKPLWEDVWSLAALREDFLEYQELGKAARWFAEMMNQPIAEGGGLIKAENICYRPDRLPDDVQYGFLTVDPAISQEKWANRAVVCVHGWIAAEQQWQIVATRDWRGIDPTQFFYEIIKLAAEWHIRIIGVEAVAMQKVLKHHFEHLRLVNNLRQYEFVDIPTGNRGKTERAAAWCSMLSICDPLTGQERHPEYALTYGDFIITQQILMYEPMKRDNDDDALDAAAMGAKMLELHLHKILSTLPHIPHHTASSIYEIAAV